MVYARLVDMTSLGAWCGLVDASLEVVFFGAETSLVNFDRALTVALRVSNRAPSIPECKLQKTPNSLDIMVRFSKNRRPSQHALPVREDEDRAKNSSMCRFPHRHSGAPADYGQLSPIDSSGFDFGFTL